MGGSSCGSRASSSWPGAGCADRYDPARAGRRRTPGFLSLRGSPMPDTPTQARVAGQPPPVSEAEETMPAAREVLLYFLLLGFINVGGPVAQITMMFNQM